MVGSPRALHIATACIQTAGVSQLAATSLVHHRDSFPVQAREHGSTLEEDDIGFHGHEEIVGRRGVGKKVCLA